jgi:hypothetical protein
MSVFHTQVQDLDAAQQVTSTRARGSAEVRNAKAAIVVTSLESLRTYVQSVCDASPEQAETLIAAAAMHVAVPPGHHKPILSAKTAPVMGDVKLVANRKALVGKTGKHVTFHWQSSVDGGKTWVEAPSTPLASTVVHGLPSMATVAFRVSATVGTATGDWSQAVSIRVD